MRPGGTTSCGITQDAITAHGGLRDARKWGDQEGGETCLLDLLAVLVMLVILAFRHLAGF